MVDDNRVVNWTPVGGHTARHGPFRTVRLTSIDVDTNADERFSQAPLVRPASPGRASSDENAGETGCAGP
jgi:hypothetical protein